MAVINPVYIENVSDHEIELSLNYGCYYWVGDDYPRDDISDFDYYDTSDAPPPIHVPAGEKVYFGYYNTQRFIDDEQDLVSWFGLERLDENSPIRIGGSITSMLHSGDGSDESIYDEYIFAGMFCFCNAPMSFANDFKLPATIGKQYLMFAFAGSNISSLPNGFFQATEIPEDAYAGMFMQCKNLTAINCNCPKLVSVGKEALTQMFYGSGIVNADNFLASLPEELGLKGCSAMFALSSLESITIPNVQIANSCFKYLCRGCQSLRTVKILIEDIGISADDDWSYSAFEEAFRECGNLESIECHFDHWNQATGDEIPTLGWVSGVSETGTFYCDDSKLGLIYDNDHIPTGWTVAPFPTPVPTVTARAHGVISIDGFAIKGSIDANAEGHFNLAGANLAAEMGGKKGNSRGTIHY